MNIGTLYLCIALVGVVLAVTAYLMNRGRGRFVGSLRQASMMVMSMESRAFGAYPQRTFVDVPRMRASGVLVCLEHAEAEDHAEAGTGLNIGPNAMKCLAMHLPLSIAAITAHGLPGGAGRCRLPMGSG